MSLKSIFARIKGVTKEEVITEGDKSITLNIRQTFFASSYHVTKVTSKSNHLGATLMSSLGVTGTTYGILPDNVEAGRAKARQLLQQ